MGRQQQITLLAAEAAHNTRVLITKFLHGACDVPTYDKLDDEKRTSVIRHTSVLLAGEIPAVDESDEVARLVAQAIERADSYAAGPQEPQFEAPPPASVDDALDKMRVDAARMMVEELSTDKKEETK